MFASSSLISRVRWSLYSMPDRDVSKAIMELDLSQYFPLDEKWILRNLTTQEYVRAEAIALKPEYINGPIIRGEIGFGEVVLSRICWSSNICVNMSYNTEEYNGNIHRGVWAGHRFDIRC